MRLLIFSEFSAGRFLEGTNLITFAVAKHLAGRGHQVVVLTPHWRQDRGVEERYFREDGVEIYKYPFPGVANPVLRTLYYFLNGLRLHRRYRFDIVLGLYTLPPSLAAVLLGCATGMKKVGTIWEPVACERIGRLPFLPPILRRADGILTMAQDVKKRIVEALSLPPDKVTVIPGFSDLTLFSPGPKSTGLLEAYALEGKFVILFVGRISALKGAPDLIKAVEGLEDVKVLMVGREVEHESFRDLIGHLGLGNRVHLLGYQEQEVLSDLYRTCDCFVLPSLNEGFGLVLAEAMACGKPVIVSDAPPLPEVAGRAGLVFRRGDIQGLRRAILKLRDSSALREELGKEALERARLFDKEKVMDQYLQFFVTLAPPSNHPSSSTSSGT
ncbi:MAG: glycosyltransferase family 4 protein [Candidatus Hydrothermarchaeota archaeon]